MEIEDDEILQGFIEESLEHLADIENDLLAIEEDGENIDEDLVNKVFRAAHSIKGGAGFMGLTTIQELSHSTENVLGLIRSKKLTPTPKIVNVLLRASDQLQSLIEDIHNSNQVDISSHIIPLNAIESGDFSQPEKDADTKKTEETLESHEESPQTLISDQAEDIEVETNEPIVSDNITQEEPEVSPPTVHPQAEEHPAAVRKETGTVKQSPPAKTEATLRVHVSLLDSLMNLAGELVLSRNQLLQTIGSDDLRNAETVGQRIDLITSELQEAIMLTRMQPIGNVFNKFPRVVRDLATKLGKNVDLTIVGKDVELDKTIIEAINDPLTHLVRNSVDHGIETPQDRKNQGKDETGLVILKAYHEAGQVVIEISDDGKGLDGQALAASAANKGLLTVEQAQAMSDKEKVNLIFLPGFSTAQTVTDVSGRGVGMDVVKTNLDQLGGNVDIISDKGVGTTISIKLPLTLAIIPCQIIESSGERYAIPQVNLEELLRIPASQVKDRVERVGDAEVVRLRGTLLPLIRLADVLQTERTYYDYNSADVKADRRTRVADRRSKESPLFYDEADQETVEQPQSSHHRSVLDRRHSASSALNIVVVSTGSIKYGLIVDRLQDSEEIVIKPLGRHLQQCKGYAGATIMGDGRIALILDVSNLARMAHLTSIDGSDRAAEIARDSDDALRAQKDRQSLLIFKNSHTEHFAVPLNQVERIEKIKNSDIEDLGGKRVMKYRGGSLSLIRVDDVAMVQPIADDENLLVIVFNLAENSVGLLAIGPIDTVEITADVDDITLAQPGIMGSIIIDQQTTMLVNVHEMVQTLCPQWFVDKEIFETNGIGSEEPPIILIAEDSKFFRNQVKGYMEEVGYKVIEAEDGLQGWELLQEHGNHISMLVTDIEMPNMDGFELTQTIRASQQFSSLPIVALTTLASAEDVARGKAVGIDDYHIKLDKERLMVSVHHHIKQRY